MRALALTGFDEQPVVMDVPEPEPGPGEVLVRVGAASLNPYDLFVAGGMMRDYLEYRFPAVIGGDLAGVVERLGDGVEGFRIGDRVFGMRGMKPTVQDGAFAELAVPLAASLAPTPDEVDDARAACLGVAGTTAASAIGAIDPSDGETVLIIGATGGVGSFAIQLAAARGARVIASVRPGDEGFVTDLGAAETVDYTGDVLGEVRERYPDGVDALADLVHRDPTEFTQHVGLVHEGGRAVSVVGGAGEHDKIGTIAVSNAGGDPSRLAELAELVRKGSLAVPIRRTYPLGDAAHALRDLAEQHTVGKLVIVS